MKNRNISSKIKRSKVTGYAALRYPFPCERNMICLGDIKLKKTHGNWKCIFTDLKIIYTLTLFTLYVSISLVTMFILSRVYFQYQVDFFAFLLDLHPDVYATHSCC